MITVLHRGGYAQMITILHGGGGSLGTPKSDYVICARPLSCHELSKVVKSWQKLLSKVGKSCQKLAKTVPFLGYIVLWEDLTVFMGTD